MGSSAKAFLCVVIALAVCQATRNFPTGVIADTQYNDNFHHYSFLSGSAVVPKISGGLYARHGQFPFMAVVHRLLGSGRISQCGGTILSRRWVLTAGHCIVKYPLSRFHVVFGIIDKSDIGYDSNAGPGVSMITTQTFLHPQYSQTVNDIGLLYMPRDIPFSSVIQPIKLASPAYTERSFNNMIAYVIGWGRDSATSTGTIKLKYATLPIISNYKCRLSWDVAEKNICTAAGLGEDACQGDSGGPLIVMENGEALQVGIVSYGDADCPSNKPGVFTRVSSFAYWIESMKRHY